MMKRKQFLGIFPAALAAGILNSETLFSMPHVPNAATQKPTAPFRKKLICNGWDIPNTQYLSKNHLQMEKEAPFDGVIFKVRVEDNGKVYDSLRTWDSKPWNRKALQGALVDLKASKFTKFTDNFLRIEVVPGNDDWFDDVAWNAIVEKFGHLAWLAKQGGAKGIQFDPEHYNGKPFQFKPASGKSFDATFAKVRERGRQVIKAIGAEFPDIVFLSFWLTSRQYPPDVDTDLRTLLESKDDYGLFPAFFNGILDEALPTIRFVDGNENAFYAKDEIYYLRAYNHFRQAIGHGGQFIYSENKNKFKAQVEVGSSFYLDMHVNIPSDQGGSRVWAGAGDQYVRKPLPGLSQLETLGEFLGYALSSVDEYVWIWGEQSRWWSSIDITHHDVSESVGKGRLWEEALPGITAQIEKVRNLHAAPEPIENLLK